MAPFPFKKEFDEIEKTKEISGIHLTVDTLDVAAPLKPT